MSQTQKEINKDVKGIFITKNPTAVLLGCILKLVDADKKDDRITYGEMAIDAFEEYVSQIKEERS